MVVRRELISGLAATVGCMYVRDAPTQHMKCHAPLPVCLSASFAADVHALRAPVTGQLAVVLALLLAVPTARSLTGGRCH